MVWGATDSEGKSVKVHENILSPLGLESWGGSSTWGGSSRSTCN